MPSLKHTHTYMKYKTRPGYWKCADPRCTHFIDRERVVNKISRCTSCGAEFLLTSEDLERVRPLCMDCSNTKKAKILRRNRDLASQAIATYAAINTPHLQEGREEHEELPYGDEEDRF